MRLSRSCLVVATTSTSNHYLSLDLLIEHMSVARLYPHVFIYIPFFGYWQWFFAQCQDILLGSMASACIFFFFAEMCSESTKELPKQFRIDYNMHSRGNLMFKISSLIYGYSLRFSSFFQRPLQTFQHAQLKI